MTLRSLGGQHNLVVQPVFAVAQQGNQRKSERTRAKTSGTGKVDNRPKPENALPEVKALKKRLADNAVAIRKERSVQRTDQLQPDHHLVVERNQIMGGLQSFRDQGRD